MRCLNICMVLSAVFEVVLKIKGYLLKMSAIMIYSALLHLKKLVVRSCHWPSGMSIGSINCTACCFKLGTYGTSLSVCWVSRLYLSQSVASFVYHCDLGVTH